MGHCSVYIGRAIAKANAAALEAREAIVAREALQNMQATKLHDVGHTLVPELHELQQSLNEKKLKGEISAAYDLLLEEGILESDSHDQDLRKRGPATRNPLVSPKFPRKCMWGPKRNLQNQRDHSDQLKHCTWP